MSTKTMVKKFSVVAVLTAGTLTGITALEPGLAGATPIAWTVDATAVAATEPAMQLTLPTHRDFLVHSTLTDSPPVERAPVKTAPAWLQAPTWAQKTWAFTQCIFGVGVPIGLGWSIVSNPALLAWFAGRGPLPASAGGAAANYLAWIKGVCGYALR
jgi:hypothetical protein